MTGRRGLFGSHGVEKVHALAVRIKGRRPNTWVTPTFHQARAGNVRAPAPVPLPLLALTQQEVKLRNPRPELSV